MRIAWKYIDKARAAIAAVRDYGDMRSIINTTPEEIKALCGRMSDPKAANLTGSPGARDPQSGEKKLIEQIDQMDVLQERYRQALEYMAWFEPAWGTLTDTERTVLTEFYASGNQRSGANARLQIKLNFAEAQIERIRSKALSRLITLLFGK